MIILGRLKDAFTETLYNAMRERMEGVSYHPFSYRIFPDDECLVRICDELYLAITAGEARFPPGSERVRAAIRNDPEVLFLNRGASGYKWKPVHEFVNALFSSIYLKHEMGAERVCLALPNMPFGKQDKLFYDKDGRLLDGAPIALKISRSLLRQHADLLVSFNPHDFRNRTGWVVKDENSIPGASRDSSGRILDKNGRVILPEAEDWTGFAYAINAMPVLVGAVMEMVENPFIVGTDQSVSDDVNDALEECRKRYSNAASACAEKTRDMHLDCTVTSDISGMPEDLSSYDAVLIDDVIVTATSMESVLDILEKRRPEYRPRRRICAAVHGEFSYNMKRDKSAYDLLNERGAEILVTDSIETPVSRVSIVQLLADELCKIM